MKKNEIIKTEKKSEILENQEKKANQTKSAKPAKAKKAKIKMKTFFMVSPVEKI